MRISVIAVGGRQPGWVQEACATYLRRLQSFSPVEMVEIPLARRGRGGEAQARRQEGKAILDRIPTGARVIAMDVRGSSLATEQLADHLGRWREDGRDCYLLIGGPDGLDQTCLERADARWSLSALTLPHGLARVVLVEALYRAATLLAGHPYHRA